MRWRVLQWLMFGAKKRDVFVRRFGAKKVRACDLDVQNTQTFSILAPKSVARIKICIECYGISRLPSKSSVLMNVNREDLRFCYRQFSLYRFLAPKRDTLSRG